ncbi:MAG: hypothetical protein HRU17_08125 [Polyangiaceae bacterium]|nr:hypothetical protein [Polyangiaceae bacterium]
MANGGPNIFAHTSASSGVAATLYEQIAAPGTGSHAVSFELRAFGEGSQG